MSLHLRRSERDAVTYWLYLELRVHELAEMFAALSVFLSLFLGWVSTVPRCSCVSDGQGSSVRVRVKRTTGSLSSASIARYAHSLRTYTQLRAAFTCVGVARAISLANAVLACAALP